MADGLTYSISNERLQGTIGAAKFSMRAWSGGGRGRTGSGADHDAASYDSFRKESGEGTGHVHGGPIPPGLYIAWYVAHHHTFGECIFLMQTLSSLVHIDTKADPRSADFIKMYNRDGFFIHGRGAHGSDGCIVPESSSERHRLNKAVKAARAVALTVVDEGPPVKR